MKNYTFFWESDSCFSNWHPARFTHKGKSFANSEQAFMWEKAKTAKTNRIPFSILNRKFRRAIDG